MANENETQATQNNTQANNDNTKSIQENNKALEEKKKSFEEFLKFQEKSNKLTSEQIKLEFDYLRAVGDVNSARQKYTELLKQLEQNQAAYTAQGHEYFELLTKEGELTQEQIEQKEKLEKSLGKEAKQIEENIRLTEELTRAKKELGEISQKDQETVEKLSQTFQSMTMGLIDMNAGVNHSITRLGMLTKSFLNADDAGQVLTESFMKVFNFGNIAAELFDTVKDATIGMAKSFDDAAAQFSKTTGLAREYNDVLYQTQRAGNQFGVSAKEGADAMGSLLAEFSDFHKTAPSVQKDLALNVGQLSKFGVSTQESTKLMQNFNKIMGMSGKEAIETSKKIGMMGTQIGISTSKMLKDYTSSLKTLAVYGDKSIKVFTGIAAAAKSAGVETGTLLGMVEKFDTFAGAAEGAGKLNAILGSQLSATEMLMMSEDERLKTMITTMQATGQSFASMDKFTQKAIAQAAGISDMAEANKIFGMSMSEYENYEMQMNQSAKTQERFEEALKSMQPFMEKLSILANEFAVNFLPVLEALIVPLDWIISLMGLANEKSDGLAGSILGAASAFYLFSKAIGLTNLKIFKSIGLKAKEAAASLVSFFHKNAETEAEIANTASKEVNNKVTQESIATQQVANKTAASGVGPMLALGAAIAMIGGGVYLAATGLAEFVKAFSLLSGEQLDAAASGLVIFTLAFVGLIAILAAMVAGPQAAIAAGALAFLLGVGAAALAIGMGISLAALGMAKFIESLSGLAEIANVMDTLTGVKDVGVNIVTRLSPLKELLDEIQEADLHHDLENIALITTGTSSRIMTNNAVSNLITVASLADTIKNVFNPEITINMDSDAVKDLFEDGVYKASVKVK